MSGSSCLAHVRTTDAYGQVTVTEKLVCFHCQTVFDKPGPKDQSGFCHVCFKPVCFPYAPKLSLIWIASSRVGVSISAFILR